VRSPLRRLALRFVDTYQRRVAPDLGTACPFEPTCSEYGRHAFERHNTLRATIMVLGRLRRCRPGYSGSFIDPVD
jgi:putative membrane protein insertion efficiency factor